MIGILVLAGCADPTVEIIPNQIPGVRISGGPLDGSRASYTTRIFWTGWDEDGVVVHFEYAVDPPIAFTLEEIETPESFPGITVEEILGPTQDQDTLRISKIVDGRRVSFDWVETLDFNRSFAFQTPDPDSVIQGGGLYPASTFSGLHTVLVRAVDNEDAYSTIDRIGFQSFSITPSSEISRPTTDQEISNLGPLLTASWEGLDPDSPEADKQPVGFLYKLIRLDTLDPPVSPIGITSPNFLFKRGGDWIYQSADTAKIAINLGTPGQYIFGVRAVDVAGATEPFLDFGRNAFKFQAFPKGGKPILTVSEPTIGTFQFRGLEKIAEAEVPARSPLRFRWSATAEDYGGEIESYSWGVDIVDLDRDGPDSGWSGWGPSTGNFEPIIFQQAGLRLVYIRVRDVAGAMTLGTILLTVVDFTFDREILFLDDSFDRIFPRDWQHDTFWRERLRAYPGFAGTQIFEHHVQGPDDLTLAAMPPDLEGLGRYKLLIWECLGSGYDGQTALLKLSAIRPILAGYLSAGGKLWLGGRMTVAATITADGGRIADLNYPKENLAKGMFAWDYLKLHTTKLNNDKGAIVRNKLARAIPFPNDPVIYDTMNVDPSKIHFTQDGVSHVDAVFDPIFAETEVDFVGNLDSLYVYGAVGNILLGTSSGFHNRLMAFRWHDSDPSPLHGRVQWFGFPLYFFQDSEVQETVNRSLDWFQEERLSASP